MKTTILVCALAVVLLAGASQAQEPPDQSKWVSRDEYERLRKEFEAFRAEVRAARQAPPPNAPAPAAAPAAPAQREEIDALSGQIEQMSSQMKELVKSSEPGTTKFLITGYAFSGFTAVEGENSTFNAGFNPIFLWHLNDSILFEGELETALNGAGDTAETSVELEYANLSLIVNDYITVGAGKFLAPFGTFSERLHPAWVNKLPDAPLAFGHDGLGPASSVGAYVRGGYPAGSMKGNYAFYVSNGPVLNTEDEAEFGRLHFDNFEDINHNKAVGGRVGFLPIPELELGYSFEISQAAPDGFSDTWAFLQAVDVSYIKDPDWLGGTIEARLEWIFSDVDGATFDPDGSLGFGPVTFNNRRNGGYAQLAYRPTHSSNKFIRNLEGVFRYDRLDNPGGAPESFDEDRFTVGLNYWFNASTVLKTAYEFDDKSEGRDANAFLTQIAIGF